MIQLAGVCLEARTDGKITASDCEKTASDREKTASERCAGSLRVAAAGATTVKRRAVQRRTCCKVALSARRVGACLQGAIEEHMDLPAAALSLQYLTVKYCIQRCNDPCLRYSTVQ